jgi:steroid 5-alpha reductase family enzyme
MNIIEDILARLFIAIIFLSIAFAVAYKKRRYDLIDSFWGATFVAITLVGLANISSAGFVLSMLVIIWGMRLSYHILRRFLKSRDEDKRYIQLRQNWRGNIAFNMYARVYIVQAILATIICLSIIILQHAELKWSWSVWIGIAVWAIGFFFEVVGDAQLRRHLSVRRNKGKLMTSGLWRYTRHPNYFGEATMWWGIWVATLATPLWWLALVSPLLITYLLLFVSGVPLTENAFEGRPGWKEYKARTSIFLPLPPKKV